jgi:hypothetical protein
VPPALIAKKQPANLRKSKEFELQKIQEYMRLAYRRAVSTNPRFVLRRLWQGLNPLSTFPLPPRPLKLFAQPPFLTHIPAWKQNAPTVWPARNRRICCSTRTIPVDWFAWNDEAFARARAENKPIFLSIGYSTCHWCHVMERESFEDEKSAPFLREHFVSIKVDREERPDVDKIYMTFVQSTTGGGGWPMNVFLTPGAKAVFRRHLFSAGQSPWPPQFSPGASANRAALARAQIGNYRQRGRIARAPGTHHRARYEGACVAHAGVLRQALALFKDAYDPANGGFGGAPKFPQPSLPSFVLRAAKRFGDDEAVKMVLHTCRKDGRRRHP